MRNQHSYTPPRDKSAAALPYAYQLSALPLDEEIIASVKEALYNGRPKKTFEALKSHLMEKAKMLYPDEDQAFIRDALESELKRALERARAIRLERDEHKALRLDFKTLSLKQINFLDIMFGALGLMAMLVALCVIPLISASTLTEAGKIGLLADSAALSGIFGITGLAGIFSSTLYRYTLKTDEQKRRFDQFLLKGTIAATLVWLSTLALSAYPLTFGKIPNDAWGTQTVDTDTAKGFTFTLPVSFTLIATGVMEIFGGAVFHLTAAKMLTPKRLFKAEKNPVPDVYSEQVIPEADVDVEAAQLKLQGLDEADHYLRMQRQAYVSHGVARYQTLLSEARSTSYQAVHDVLRAAQQPETKASLDTSKTTPTGQAET